jgi:hypothetical protein
MKNKMTKPKRKPAGYSIKESQLGEMIVLECMIRQNVSDTLLIQDRMLKIAASLGNLRNRIRNP